MNLLIKIPKEFLLHLYRGLLHLYRCGLLGLYRLFKCHQAILTYTEDEFYIPKLDGILDATANKKIKWRWRIIPLKFSRKSEGWKKEKWRIEDLAPYCTKHDLSPNSDERDTKTTNQCDTEITFETKETMQRLNNPKERFWYNSLICTHCGDEIFSYEIDSLGMFFYKKRLAIEAKNQIERQLRRRTG